MAEFDYPVDKCEGMLEISDNAPSQDSYHFEAKKHMLASELQRISLQTITSGHTQLILNALNSLLDNPEESHNQTCHSRSHVSTGGGTGWSNSYSKKC